LSAHRRSVIEKAAALRLPAIREWPDMAEEGGLIEYGPSLPLLWRQAARLAVKVFHGVKPQDMPVEQPSNFDRVVNLAAAKALELRIPELFLVRADKVSLNKLFFCCGAIWSKMALSRRAHRSLFFRSLSG
jgi:putative tryptophan/tyrosine transport system substrate-binding protein